MHLCAARSASLIQRSIDHQTSLPTLRILLLIHDVSTTHRHGGVDREEKSNPSIYVHGNLSRVYLTSGVFDVILFTWCNTFNEHFCPLGCIRENPSVDVRTGDPFNKGLKIS